jgi:sucrose synthase
VASWWLQVVYILDQVRAMECEMLENIRQQGLDIKPQIVVVTRRIPNAHGTTCNQRVEKIIGTKHSFILRVPFRHEGRVLRNWVSRFDVYPFLEQFVVVSQNYPWQDQTNIISTA